MTTEITGSNYKEAVSLLNKWAYAYYTLNDTMVTDAVYDELYFKVKKYEEDNKIINKNSPTQRIGDVVLDGFVKAYHKLKMYSLDDVFNIQEFLDWANKIKAEYPSARFYEEPKYDGLSLNLLYEDGVLVKAITRGDGEIGEDVTENVHLVKGIPLNIPYTEDKIEIRGEVTIFKSDFEEVNNLRELSGKDLFTNERNAASGALRSYDSISVKNANLRFTPYGLGFTNINFETQSSSYEWILSQGFINWGTKTLVKSYDSPQDVVDSYLEILENRNNFPMLLDGVVVKVDQKSIQSELGFTIKFPRWATAFKFPAQEKKVLLKNVIFQVGKTGAITPVAELEPTDFGGTIVTRATLHNMSEIKKHDIKIGDKVNVIKSGDVIPKILGAFHMERTGNEIEIHEPTNCPVCNSEVIKKQKFNSTEFGVNIYCSNTKCPAIISERLAYAVGKKAFNMVSFGDSAIKELVDKKFVTSIVDIFKLTKEDLLQLEGFKDRKAQKTIDSIVDIIGKIDVYRLINALDIEGVGERASKKISTNERATKLIFGLEEQPTLEDFTSIEDIGSAIAYSILSFIETNVDEARELFQVVNPVMPNYSSKTEILDNPIKDNIFVITGTLSQPREHFQSIVESLGGKVGSSVSKKTNYVLAGDSAGSKLDKAKELGIKVLTEEEFNTLLNS